jgi:hypothetical protein
LVHLSSSFWNTMSLSRRELASNKVLSPKRCVRDVRVLMERTRFAAHGPLSRKCAGVVLWV